jgi:hypothetical protein
VFPGLDDVVQLVTGTLGVGDLPLADELVVLGELIVLEPLLEESDRDGDLLLGRTLVAEVPDEGDADAPVIVIVRVRARRVPSPALVRVPVAPDEEIIADVDPALGLDVERLDHAHVQDALGFVVAGLRRRVADYRVSRRLHFQLAGRIGGWLSSPIGSRY